MTDELFPAAEVAALLDDRGIAVGEPMTAERIGGGRSNVMVDIGRGGHRLVLRRPARVAIAKANDGIRREWQVLSALNGTGVPCPQPLALHDQGDESVVFYLMEHVDGSTAISLSEALGPAESVRAEVTYTVTDGLAALHNVDWRAQGLADFGRPDGFHTRQVDRWVGQLDSYGPRRVDGIDDVGEWLREHIPVAWKPTIMHGDYHMLNVMIANDPPVRLAAIVDWETATIGDPLLDLAGFLEVWCGAFSGDGWPERSEIIDRYQASSRIEVPEDLRYYEVLYNFRLGVLLEGIYQRSVNDSSRDTDEFAGQRAAQNFARAQQLIAP
jgi:aminoglycoside phosphotransferase (APT) family kinase protein